MEETSLYRRRNRAKDLQQESREDSTDFHIGSEEEHENRGLLLKRPSKVTVNENLTILVDEENVLDAPTTSHSQERLLHEGKKKEELPNVGFFSYFWSELTRGYSLDSDQARYTEKRRKVYAFFRIPYELEKFIFFGMLQCIDAFFYLFTFLPIRFILSLLGLIFRLRRLTAAEICDILKVGIILFSSYAMQYIDTSMVYHQVRGQGVIKLYMFFNMLEVADKLFSSLGQDVLDSLFWTANEPKSIRNFFWTLLHFFFAVGYAISHTFLVLLQATTLNVAFNSHNQSLLMIMMSNNFVEIKGSVFKKFAKANLFQMSCSDVRERFHIIALLVVVLLRNMMAVNWSIDHFSEMLPDLAIIWVAELLVDYLKHGFITKFNEINADVYKDFTLTLAFDVVKSRGEAAYSDYSDQVSRRMGFIPIPLSIMIIRVISQTFSFNNVSSILVLCLVWLLLVVLKVFNGVLMLRKACQYVSTYRDLQARAEMNLFRKRLVEKKSRSAPSSPKISIIDFNDVLHQAPGINGPTMTEVISQLENLKLENRSFVTPKITAEERTPRRAKSFVNLSRSRRDTSEPPAGLTDSDAECKARESVDEWDRNEREDSGQASPKKKVKEEKPTNTTVPGGDSETLLSDVTAYKMLQPDQGVERIE
ncbi:unnamed protein product, partial [Mesorhabditis belari]|uniref:Protein TAPT1 homolog n=1 Tax=Mesorhabditis belari TaxID=2138241 RepID=A0AAF3FD80_9BILA